MSTTIAGGPARDHRADPEHMESGSRVQRSRALTLTVLLAAACGSGSGGGSDATAWSADPVLPGIDVLLTDSLHLVAGRRLGLITNHTGRDRSGRPDIDVLAERTDMQLVGLFSPEHGIRGEVDQELVESGVDARTGLPIHSLYGPTLSSRSPTPAMLEGIDVLLFDIQDIGARYYTYVSTMALAMEAAGEAGIPFIVLDRPNPVRGDVVQGNVLDPEFSSFVGRYPVAMRHGMTPGELARMYVGAFGIDVELHVVPVDGLRRDMTYADTGLEWIAPSLNMPSLASALAYPGICLFEGTPLSVGRGTDRAFEWIGAPWLDGEVLAEAMNGYGFAGVSFEAARFTPRAPTDGKFDGTEVQGVRLVASSSDYDAPAIAVALLVETRRASGDEWVWRAARFDQLAGTDRLRLGLDAGEDLPTLTAGWAQLRAAFEALRAPYLIYR